MLKQMARALMRRRRSIAFDSHQSRSDTYEDSHHTVLDPLSQRRHDDHSGPESADVLNRFQQEGDLQHPWRLVLGHNDRDDVRHENMACHDCRDEHADGDQKQGPRPSHKLLPINFPTTLTRPSPAIGRNGLRPVPAPRAVVSATPRSSAIGRRARRDRRSCGGGPHRRFRRARDAAAPSRLRRCGHATSPQFDARASDDHGAE
jgi:hypothetical protein